MTLEKFGVQANPHIHNEPHMEPLAETVVAARPADFEPKRTVVVPIDASTHSEYTLQWALENVIKADSDLVLLLNARGLTLELQSYQAGQPDSSALDFVNHQSVSRSTELLQKFAKKLGAHGVRTELITLAGDPRYTIVEKIHRVQPSLVVIGQRGMGSFTRAILGSVSDYIVHHAHVPVTVVSQPKA
jgi:nucleotide-binding universal stress UspA family protein